MTTKLDQTPTEKLHELEQEILNAFNSGFLEISPSQLKSTIINALQDYAAFGKDKGIFGNDDDQFNLYKLHQHLVTIEAYQRLKKEQEAKQPNPALIKEQVNTCGLTTLQVDEAMREIFNKLEKRKWQHVGVVRKLWSLVDGKQIPS